MVAPVGYVEPELSIVIPMLDEQDNLGPLLAELKPALEPLGTYEIIFVDDGSRDRSREIALEARGYDRRIELIVLSRNFGQQAALLAGLDHARGRAVVLMDADLQDPPELIVEFVERWRAGFDVVYGVRASRQEGRILRACFQLFYRLINSLSDTDLPVDSGDFCLMDRQVVDVVRSLPGRRSYLRGWRSWVGFEQIGVGYDRRARGRGETKYSRRARFRFALDGLVSFSDVPLRLAPAVALATGALGLAALAVAAVLSQTTSGRSMSGPLAYLALALVSVQLLITGVIAAHLSRQALTTNGRPDYVVRARYLGSDP